MSAIIRKFIKNCTLFLLIGTSLASTVSRNNSSDDSNRARAACGICDFSMYCYNCGDCYYNEPSTSPTQSPTSTTTEISSTEPSTPWVCPDPPTCPPCETLPTTTESTPCPDHTTPSMPTCPPCECTSCMECTEPPSPPPCTTAPPPTCEPCPTCPTPSTVLPCTCPPPPTCPTPPTSTPPPLSDNPQFTQTFYSTSLPSWPVAGTTIHMGIHANTTGQDPVRYELLTSFQFLTLSSTQDIIFTSNVSDGAFVGPNNVMVIEVVAIVIGDESRKGTATLIIVFPRSVAHNHEALLEDSQ